MRTLKSVLSEVAANPSSLEGVFKSVHSAMLEMDLDNTFVVAYTPDDVYEVAEDMGLVTSSEQATEVLTYLIDNYNPTAGVNIENFKQAIESVTGLKRQA